MQTKTTTNSFILRDILAEIRLLRNEIKLVLPREDLKLYAHPRKIKQAYTKALRQHPPR
ncbi:MAG: hypothetical protein HYV13_02570 [Candidatus Doudnabacteria bacterium]|nr:hypothetical protein [Candidatus Doudnabacteria bacterium]